MRISWFAALCLLLPATGQAAAPHLYSVDDMLALESYGGALFDPGGRWAVIDRYRRYDSAPAYHYDAFTRRALGRIMRVDLLVPSPLRPLFPQDDQAGYWTGSLSPSGRLLSVFRLMGDTLSLGIVDVAKETVRWLPVNPSISLLNPAPTWIDDRRILLVARDRSDLPPPLDAGGRLQRALPELWGRSDKGEKAGVSLIASQNMTSAATADPRRLIEIDLESGSSQVRATGALVDVALSPDQRWIAVTLEDGDTPIPQGTLVRSSELPRRRIIKVIRRSDGQVETLCRDCDIMPNLLEWSPDGSRLLYFSRRPGRDWAEGRLYVHDAHNGRSTEIHPKGTKAWLPEDDSGARLVRAGWFDGVPFLYATTGNGTRAWLRAPGGKALSLPCAPPQLMRSGRTLWVSCPDGLWRMNPSGKRTQITGRPVQLARLESETFDIGIRARYRGIAPVTPAYVATNAGPAMAHIIGRDQAPPVALPSDLERVLGLSPVTTAGLAMTQTRAGTGGLWLIRPGLAPVKIDSINTHLADLALPIARLIPHPNGGLVDWLLLPASARQDERLALIVVPYPGTLFPAGGPPPLAPARMASAVNPLLLTSLGYAVLMPSLPHDRSEGEPSRYLADQIVASADRAIATGWVDGDRMALYGHSFGGYTALAVASRTRRFRAYIAGASVPDLTLQHGQFMPYDRIGLDDGFPLGASFGWAETGQAQLGGGPWQDPARYRRNSPYYQLAAIADPLLLIHGDLDPVTVAGPERLFGALYRQGRNVSLLRYWGEGHVVRSPANIRDMWQRIADWLTAQLRRSDPSAMPKAG